MNSYVALDVETANADLCSICQVGLVHFEGGEPVGQWETLVNPDDFFDPFNVSIHGITEKMVGSAPSLPAVFAELASRLEGQVAVCHTHFDRTAVFLCAERIGASPPSCEWLDTARVARRAWSQFGERGYGLASVATALGISFRHHDALEDARAAGLVLAHAIRESGITLAEWLLKARQPIASSERPLSLEGNPDGPLAGEVVVFTGALSLSRREAAAYAASAGCAVRPGVTKDTTLLVVGDQDIRRLAGHEKSGKHRKAEKLLASGQFIRILRESDFQRMVTGI